MNFSHNPDGGVMTRIGRAMRATPSRGIVVAPSGEILETVSLKRNAIPVHTDLLDGYAAILAAIAKAPNRPAIHAFDHRPLPAHLSQPPQAHDADPWAAGKAIR